ncbi:MAG: cation:proton antiporter [Clostridium sp.]|nr:cation:proton antiporter [Clostridium sp.]
MELHIFLYLGIALVLALLSSKLIKKLHLPNVTGYLIMGLLAGPYVLKLIPLEAVESFKVIPEIALGFIAFSIGAEFKLKYLKKVGKSPVVIAVLEALVAVILVDLALLLTGHSLEFSLLLGSIAAATAPAATLMVVRQYKAKGPLTDTLLPVVAIDDAVALMVFGISVAIVKTLGSTQDVSIIASMLAPLVEIVGALVVGGLLGVGLSFLAKWFTGRGNRLSVAIGMIALNIGLSQMFGLSELLSCMAMSAVFVNLSKHSGAVFEQVDRFTPPVFMLFFFLSGADLNVAILPSVGVVGLIYLFVRVIGKVPGAALGAKLSGADPVVQKYLGYTLIPQAGVAIGLASVAMTISPVYGQQIKIIILAGTVIYELVGPVATKLALMKAGEIKSEAAEKKVLNPAV